MVSHEDIRFAAELPIIFFGDMYPAQIGSMKPGKNQDGQDTWDMCLKASPQLIKKYKLEVNKEGNFIYDTQIPMSMVKQMNPDPSFNRWLCYLDFEGKPVYAWSDNQEVKLREENLLLREQINNAKLQLDAVTEELNLSRESVDKYMDKRQEAFSKQAVTIISQMANKPTQ